MTTSSLPVSPLSAAQPLVRSQLCIAGRWQAAARGRRPWRPCAPAPAGRSEADTVTSVGWGMECSRMKDMAARQYRLPVRPGPIGRALDRAHARSRPRRRPDAFQSPSVSCVAALPRRQ